jgi:hypothetical protein
MQYTRIGRLSINILLVVVNGDDDSFVRQITKHVPPNQAVHQVIPTAIVTLRLTSGLLFQPFSSVDPSVAKSSRFRELDFHPQLCLMLKTSGALVNCVKELPVALAQDIVKYADIDGRGSLNG